MHTSYQVFKANTPAQKDAVLAALTANNIPHTQRNTITFSSLYPWFDIQVPTDYAEQAKPLIEKVVN